MLSLCRLEDGRLEFGRLVRERRGQVGLDLVGPLPGRWPLVGRQFRNPAQDVGEATLAAEVGDPPGLGGLDVRSLLQIAKGPSL